MPANNTFALLIVILLIIVVVTWLFYTIRTIRYQKRIINYSMPTLKEENYSLIDKLIEKYNQVKKRLEGNLEKLSFKKENLSQTSSKIIFSLTLIIIYLLVTLLTTISFSFLALALSFLIGFYLPELYYYLKKKNYNNQIDKDLLKAISLMNNSFQSGKTLIQAIKNVYVELEGPISIEFNKIYEDILHGLSFKVAFNRFYERTNLEDIKYITSSLSILDQTGGDIVKVFSSIEEGFYTRRSLELELKSTIASSRLVFQLLVFLPVFLWLVVGLWNPDYFTIFFSSDLGLLLFSLIICIYLIYIIIIKSIMKVEKY